MGVTSAEAFLSWNLFAECPHCKEDIDLADSTHDVDGCFSVPLFNNLWEEIEGNEVDCPKCKNTLLISEVVY